MTRPAPGSVSSVVLAALLALALPSMTHGEAWTLDKMVGRDEQGRPVYRPLPVDERFRNPWPEEFERAFQERARRIIADQSEMRVSAGNTYFENEKRTYGWLMAQALGGRGLDAVRGLQIEDAQGRDWHRHTEGIDFYAAFTLKHQMRKYFYFGDLLGSDYRKRMFAGAKTWTERDPLRRPHHAFDKPKEGWGPDAKNSWVDVRTTENLFLMRVTSVYLMAEETGNRETAAAYKRTILDYAKTLPRRHRRVGQRELPRPLDPAADEPLRLRAGSRSQAGRQGVPGLVLCRRGRQVLPRRVQRPDEAGLQPHAAVRRQRRECALGLFRRCVQAGGA